MAPAEDADVHTSSPDYARRFAGAVGAWFLDVQSRATLSLLSPWPGASVLDVGGGHGQLTGPLVDAGYRVTVHGTSDVCAASVKRWVSAGRASYRTGPLLRLPFGDRAFEVVLAFRLLPHVDRWQELVVELCRVASRAVVVDYPTRRSVNIVSETFFAAKKRVESNTRPFRVFAEREIDEAFVGAGFRTTARRPEFALPMALHRAVGLAPLSKAAEAVARGLGLTAAFGSPVVRRAERRG
jgi:2-polyprenyl-3-methyl-5-hydroxy-6-metoxy-1,4-benzoquinol methylase